MNSSNAVVQFEDPLSLVNDKYHFGFEDILAERRTEAPELMVRGLSVCRYYNKGFCINGSKCPHRHGAW